MISEKINILIADDHPLSLNGLRGIVAELDFVEQIHEANDGKEALDKLITHVPPIAILDIEMPFLSGIEVAKEIIKRELPIKIIFLTLHKEKSLFDEVMKMGISGYMLKEFSLSETKKCITIVKDGGTFISSVLEGLLEAKEGLDLSIFTKSEINILKLIAQNKTSPEIANMLFVSAKTIENHRANIVRKLELPPEKNSLLKWVMKHQESFIRKGY